MVGVHGSGRGIDDGVLAGSVVRMVMVEVRLGNHGEPYVVLESSTNLKHPTSGIEGEIFGITGRRTVGLLKVSLMDQLWSW